MFTPIAVALAAAFWLAYLVALAVEKHLFDHALRLWNSLSRPKKCVASVLFVCVVAYAGTKPLSGGGDDGGDDPTGTNVVEIVEGDATNLVENIGGESSTNLVENGEAQNGEGESGEAVSRPLLMGLPPPYTSGQETASPLSDSPPAPLSLDAVGRGEPLDFSAPEGAVVATNWLMHGVTTGRVCVSTTDWDFPFGTNILRNFAAFADGRLEPWPGGNGITLAPLVASLGIVPEANWTLLAPTNRPSLFWWTMRDNALVCTWQNVLLGREIDCPVSFQAELRATGGVTYRYDLGRLASDDLLTNAVVLAWTSSPLSRDLTSLAFRSTDEVACDECAASLATALGDSDPFACPPNSTNTVLEHAYYSGTTNGAIHLPESSPALAVLRVSVGGTGSGELLVGGRAVPLRAPPSFSIPNSSFLTLSVPRGEALPVYLRGDSTLSLSLDSDDFAFGVLPDLSGRHCRGWINFPYTEASHPCIHSLMANKTDVMLPVGEGADDLTCTWNETDDVEVWNRPPRSAQITGHFDPRQERPVTYTLSHPRYLFGQTEYEQNARYCPKPSDDDPTDYLGVGIPFSDECWCCHWQTCDTNCTCGCSHCGDWTDTPTNDYDFARTNYPHMRDVLKIRTPREYSASVALSVPTGVRNCCPCPEHHTNGVSCVYARRVSVVGPSGSEFRSSGEPVTVRIAATEPSYDPGDGRALFATNGAFSLSCDYTCLGVGISAYDIDLPALNAKNRQFGLPVVINTNLDEAVEIRLDVNVLLRGGRIRLSVEDATAPLEVWGYDYVRGERVKLADADSALDVTMAEWRRMTGHADDSGVPTTYVQLLVPRTGKATLVLHYWNVIDNKFVEDEARQVVTAINPPLLPDYNRDGAINAQDVTNWLGGAIFRYWTNQDTDKGDYVGQNTDTRPNVEPNPELANVKGRLDLVNLFPLALDLKPYVDAWGDHVKFEVEVQGSMNPLRYCFANVPWSEAGSIQTEDVTTTDGESLHEAHLAEVQMQKAGVPVATVRDLLQQSGLLIAEATQSINSPIRLSVKLDDRVVIRQSLPVRIRPVREMYNWINVRNLSGEGRTRSTWCGAPSCGSGKSLVFLHGANVFEADAEKWGDTIFKRLWLTGCNVDLYNVDWRSNIGSSANYQQNASNAFEVASRLAPTIAAIPGEKVLMAHSLGNMVCSSMIQDHGLQVSKFLMCDSAVPSEAYCGQDDISIRVPQLLHPDWESYPTNTWASNWHKHFREIPDDDRKHLGWPARFPDVPAVAVNFYSTGDEVLELYENNRIGILEGITSGWVQFSWHHQEIWKGRALPGAEHLGATMWSGWGFSMDSYCPPFSLVPITSKHYTPEQASVLTSAQIRSVPVFNPYPANITNTTSMSLLVRAAHLTQGIPALGPPTGGTRFGQPIMGNATNFDLNLDNAETGIPRPHGWPTRSSYPGRWLHSDMKDVAFYYNYKFYEKVAEKGNLK